MTGAGTRRAASHPATTSLACLHIEPLEAEADPTELLVLELLFEEGADGCDLMGWWDFVI